MKAVSEENYFVPIAANIIKTLNKTKALPENVFQKEFGHYLFITFDELFTTLFFNHLKDYLLKTNEQDFFVSSIDPDPEAYFKVHFGFFGAFIFSTSDSEKDYIFALNNYPEDSPADALAHNCESILIMSVNDKFAIYGSRDNEIAICAFPDREQAKSFRWAYDDDLLANERSAAEYAYCYDPHYSDSDSAALVDEFCRNYKNDRWTHDRLIRQQ